MGAKIGDLFGAGCSGGGSGWCGDIRSSYAKCMECNRSLKELAMTTLIKGLVFLKVVWALTVGRSICGYAETAIKLEKRG